MTLIGPSRSTDMWGAGKGPVSHEWSLRLVAHNLAARVTSSQQRTPFKMYAKDDFNKLGALAVTLVMKDLFDRNKDWAAQAHQAPTGRDLGRL